MRLKLFPKEDKFFEGFLTQAQIIEEAAQILLSTFEHYEKLPENSKKIEDLEHKGDDVIRDISERMNKIFVTPIDREDIHELTSMLDDVVDYIRAANMRLSLFNVSAPTKPAKELAEIILKSAREIIQALQKLQHFQSVSPHTDKIREYEREGDRVNRSAVGDLFHNSLPVIEVIKWQEIYERLETAIDKCEDVAQIIDGISLKHA